VNFTRRDLADLIDRLADHEPPTQARRLITTGLAAKTTSASDKPDAVTRGRYLLRYDESARR